MTTQQREPAPVASRGLAWPALAGVSAGALTVGVAELGAALLVRLGASGTPSPVVALGGAFIDRTPLWLKDLAVSAFGTNDKVALLAGIAVVVIVAAAVSGVVAARHRLAGLLVVVALAAVAAAAVLSRPHSSLGSVLPTLAGALAGLVALSRLLDRLLVSTPSEGTRPAEVALARRSFLTALVGSGALAVVAGAGAVVVSRASRAVQAGRAALRLPAAVDAGPTATELASVAVPGISAMVTPPDLFYRIDTALSVPQVSPGDWHLRVHGMVENELDLSFDDLLALPMVERLTTLTCVSNEVGGDLVGNQVWLGHPLRDLLARARPLASADMVLSTSADGWTAGTPLDALTDPGRDALLAVGMGGAPLPVEHGFPVRMVVPGLYGYVSATKWVVDLEVTRFDQAEGYWTPRGWSERGPVKTASRIDVPRAGRTVRAGRVAVAGVAWAQHRGISRVQVRVDEGDWAEAVLAGGGTVDTWRQWTYAWDATRGQHTLQVRATDGQGQVQTGEQSPPAPDGATGWHTVQVSVS